MTGDPWSRKNTVMIIAIVDICLATFLLLYAGFRLMYYDYSDKLINVIAPEEGVMASVVYWTLVFAFIGVQVVIGFLLLTATNDMSTDPETMINKCNLWRIFSIIFSILLFIDVAIMLYEHYYMERRLKLVGIIIDCGEILFRFYGFYYVSKFVKDLHALFESPMVHYGAQPSPLPVIRGTLNAKYV